MATLDAESIRRKREKLEAEVAALRSAERSAAEERNAIVGRVILDHAKSDAAFAEELMRILDNHLSKRKERLQCGLSVGQKRRRRQVATQADGVGTEPIPLASSPEANE
jgi:uncharacterized coiled-coil DUF342 family protein